MSQTDAKSFIDLLIKDEAFRRQLLNELRDDDTDPKRLCELGGRQGLSFNESELGNAWKESQSTDQRALSDSDLGGVTGGTASLSELDGVTGETASLKSLPKLLEAAVKGKVFKKVEIHGTAT